MKPTKDLREFIALLNSTKVKYLMVGGHAVAFHGHPRFTGDFDFFIERSAQNAAGLAAVVDGIPVPFISKEHLLANKRAAGRPQDLAEAAELQDEKD